MCGTGLEQVEVGLVDEEEPFMVNLTGDRDGLSLVLGG